MYNKILLPAVVLIAAFYESNARVLSASSPLINKSPDISAERGWSSDSETFFISKDGEGCLNPVSSSKSKRENANTFYDFSQFFDKTNPGADSNSGIDHLSALFANDATTPEGNTITTHGSIESGFMDRESAKTSSMGGDSLEGSSIAFSNNIPGGPFNAPFDVHRDIADIAEYVPWIICIISR